MRTFIAQNTSNAARRRSAVSSRSRHIYFFRRRPRISRILLLASLTSIAFLWFWPRNPRVVGDRTLDYWTQFPSLPLSSPPEESWMLGPTDTNDAIPSDLLKPNPSFHILLPALDKSAGLCRAVTSATILNYPPPTFIKLGELSSPLHAMVSRVNGIVSYLGNSKRVNGSDLVLIADGENTIFQLPPEILIQRFLTILREDNKKLRKKYGAAVAGDSRPGEAEIQKYSQRVVFAAGKRCVPYLPTDFACVSVPKSTLPPDVYGRHTDQQLGGRRNRPRWLNSGAVIGQAADLKLIYEQVLDHVMQSPSERGDQRTLTQLYGKQEYVRELERRRTNDPWVEWFWDLVGISDATEIPNTLIDLEPGKRYEYGIGVDFKSQLFFTMNGSESDVAWFRYRDIKTSFELQLKRKIPREHRLMLPLDIRENASNPFARITLPEGEAANPPLNESIDILPNAEREVWQDLMLMTNTYSEAVPAMIYTNGDEVSRESWWWQMWYRPWARALFRNRIRSSHSRHTPRSSLFGDASQLNTNETLGGVWTDTDEWLPFEELCGGFELSLFSDGLGPWDQENSTWLHRPGAYNQWGVLISGSGPEVLEKPT